MSIRPSAAAEIRPLIESLGAADEIRREAAVARLAIIGARAVDRLTAAYADAEGDRVKRVAILRVLEVIGDARAAPVARAALHGGGGIAIAAAGVLRSLLDSPLGATAAEALDALVAVALDRTCERRVRMAALDALQDMPDAVRSRVAAAVADDPDQSVRARASASQREGGSTDAIWQDAIEGQLPDDPGALRDALQARAPSTPLGALQKLIDTLRARETVAQPAEQQANWRAVRGALHQALALRASTVAVYDLRETVAAATGPLPTTFLTALHVVGDESCLEGIAAAYMRTPAGDASASLEHGRWRQQLAAAFQAIVKRERITKTNGVLKRLAAKHPDAARALNKTSRTRPRPKSPGRT